MPDSGFQPSKQMVERGAEALASVPWSLVAENHRPFYEKRAAKVLTAALRLDDPETVERVAKALRGSPLIAWDAFPEAEKAPFRAKARAALSALLGTESDG